jgi:hypothetical protein
MSTAIAAAGRSSPPYQNLCSLTMSSRYSPTPAREARLLPCAPTGTSVIFRQCCRKSAHVASGHRNIADLIKGRERLLSDSLLPIASLKRLRPAMTAGASRRASHFVGPSDTDTRGPRPLSAGSAKEPRVHSTDRSRATSFSMCPVKAMNSGDLRSCVALADTFGRSERVFSTCTRACAREVGYQQMTDDLIDIADGKDVVRGRQSRWRRTRRPQVRLAQFSAAPSAADIVRATQMTRTETHPRRVLWVARLWESLHGPQLSRSSEDRGV